MIESHPDPDAIGPDGYGMAADTAVLTLAQGVDPEDQSTWSRTSRNAACPCGSGKKFKHCHGKTM